MLVPLKTGSVWHRVSIDILKYYLFYPAFELEKITLKSKPDRKMYN